MLESNPNSPNRIQQVFAELIVSQQALSYLAEEAEH